MFSFRSQIVSIQKSISEAEFVVAVPVPILDLAMRILSLEASRPDRDGLDPLVASRVCLKLRVPLATLMGAAGFSSLLARALVLAKADAPALAAVSVRSDGGLSGFDALDPTHSESGQSVLVAHLLALLATFIGESLTRRIVGEAWTEVEVSKGEEQ